LGVVRIFGTVILFALFVGIVYSWIFPVRTKESAVTVFGLANFFQSANNALFDFFRLESAE